MRNITTILTAASSMNSLYKRELIDFRGTGKVLIMR